MTPPDLSAIKARLAAATPDGWTCGGDTYLWAISDLAALLAEVERLTAENAEYYRAFDLETSCKNCAAAIEKAHALEVENEKMRADAMLAEREKGR